MIAGVADGDLNLLDETLAVCREVIDRALPSNDEERVRLLMFLVRAYRSGCAARELIRAGYSLEAGALARTVYEAFIEFQFIVSDEAQRFVRLNLFYGFGSYKVWKAERAIAALRGNEQSEHVAALESRWQEVAEQYASKPRDWCQQYPNLRARAKEADRVRREHLGDPDAAFAEHFWHISYGEGCDDAHPGSVSMASLVHEDQDGNLMIEVDPRTDVVRGPAALELALLALCHLVAEVLEDEQGGTAVSALLDRERLGVEESE